MKIFAVRDRLLDYYQRPLIADRAPDVLAALAKAINNGDSDDPIVQAPQHFEVWELGEVQDDGHIRPTRELICQCTSLIRPGVRDRGSSGRLEAEGATAPRQRTPGEPQPIPSNGNGATPLQNAPRTTSGPHQPEDPRSGGSDPTLPH